MIKKAIALTSFAAGYVLGARAGRERYDQICTTAQRVKNDPHLTDLGEKAMHRLVPEVDGDLRPHGATITTDASGF